MKLFPGDMQSRDEYKSTQIARSQRKFGYCKVSVHDVCKYADLVRGLDGTRASLPGPVLCLGTRNGREVDLFRSQWFGPRAVAAGVRVTEIYSQSFRSRLPVLEGIGRSDRNDLSPRSVIGVELNPQAERRDIWIGSFDEMPTEWSASFPVIYSNSFDQSQDPERTAAEWKRVLRPGGILIFCFTNGAKPTVADRVGDITKEDVLALFGGRLLHFADRGSRNGYTEVILQR